MSLSFSSLSWASIKLPAGTATLYARVKDNMDGVTMYTLNTSIAIAVNQTLVSEVMASLLANDSANSVVNTLQRGALLETTQIVTSLCSAMNGVLTSEQRVAVRDVLVDYLNAAALTDVSSLKLVASAMSSLTTRLEENSLASSVWIFFIF